MKSIGLIFPHQLFENHPVLAFADEIYIIEDSLFFGDKHHPLSFHKLKLAFHRASMKSYFDILKSKGINVHYIDYNPLKTISDILASILFDKAYAVDPTDYLLEKRLLLLGDKITLLPSPLFINTREDNLLYLKNQKRYFMHHFYQWQRKRLGFLVDEKNKPIGGKWSFDEENRKKIPKKLHNQIPPEPQIFENKYIVEAKEYVLNNFSNNPGSLDGFIYPTNHARAKAWFESFLDIRFSNFGTYEDAIVKERNILYHSLLSPLLNTGLLNPKTVLSKIISYSKEHGIAINNTEGLVRQIIGWREYMRMMYETKGSTMRNSNSWKHKKPLPKSFYDGTTGILPIDTTIKKVLNTAYCHHIERLMILGNFMFLLQTKPNDVYNWFMELFIDSYDWVMVPNVYAMSQNSARGLMTTKPYISGSNYILKMSDYKKEDWCVVWDALYWDFVMTHKDFLEKNGRMFFVVNRANQYSEDHKKTTSIKKTVRDFLLKISN